MRIFASPPVTRESHPLGVRDELRSVVRVLREAAGELEQLPEVVVPRGELRVRQVARLERRGGGAQVLHRRGTERRAHVVHQPVIASLGASAQGATSVTTCGAGTLNSDSVL